MKLDIPKCKIGKYHSWKKSSDKYGESGICVKCGWDKFEGRYRREENDRWEKRLFGTNQNGFIGDEE